MTRERDEGDLSTPEETSPGLGDRILRVVRAFFRSEGSAGDADDGTESEGLFGIAERSLTRWMQSRRRTQPWRQRPLDVLGIVGQPVELLARLDGVDAQDVQVSFFVNGVNVGLGAMTDGGIAVCAYIPETLGLHTITTELRDGGGALGPHQPQSAVLQVVPDAPLLIADARLFEVGEHDGLGALREASERGVQICWAAHRTIQGPTPIGALIEVAGLPPAAVLTIDDRALEFDTHGVDFGPVNERVFVRRLRAMGVPVVGIITVPPIDTPNSASGVTVWTLAQLREQLATPESLASIFEAAARFVAIRDQATGTLALSRRLDLMTHTQLVEGNAVAIELDNRAARHALFADIRAATSTIHLQFYLFEAGLFVSELTDLLRERARAGVRVRLVVDALFTQHRVLGRVNPLLAELSSEPNIEVRSSDPVSLGKLDTLAFKQRDHRKLAIIDGRIALVTGRNAADTYYLGFDEVQVDDTTLHEVIPWLDAHARLTGPLVAQLQAIFVANWRRNGGAISDIDAAVHESDVKPVEGGVAARVVLHDGVSDAYSLASYDALFAGARERLIVVNDFPIISDLSLRLIAAAQRGVKVDILTGNGLARRGDGTFFEGPRHRQLFEYMVKRCYVPLLNAGVRVSEFVAPDLPNIQARGGPIRPYVHAKVVVVDGCVASVGTANLDVTASHWEREVNLIIESPEVARSLTAALEALLESAYLIDLASEYWRNEAGRRALVAQLWPDSLYQ